VNLLEECIEALLNSQDKLEILNDNEKNILLSRFFETYQYNFGRIDWKNIQKKIIINDLFQVYHYLEIGGKMHTTTVYIFWDMTTLPMIKCSLKDVLNNIDDVTAVSFDTWLYCPSEGWVIEFYHDGGITLGFEK
jgi:hypothetical protein